MLVVEKAVVVGSEYRLIELHLVCRAFLFGTRKGAGTSTVLTLCYLLFGVVWRGKLFRLNFCSVLGHAFCALIIGLLRNFGLFKFFSEFGLRLFWARLRLGSDLVRGLGGLYLLVVLRKGRLLSLLEFLALDNRLITRWELHYYY